MKHKKYKATIFVTVLLQFFFFFSYAQHSYQIGQAMNVDTTNDIHLIAPVFESKPFDKPKNLINVQGNREYNNWGIKALGIDTLMKLYDGQGITTCVCDTGVPDHPDLQEYIAENGRVNVTNNISDLDQNGHATHVGGIIAEILPKGKIIFVKTLSAGGAGGIDWVVNAVDSCVARGADIINLSLGTRSEYKPLELAIDSAIAKGVLVVAAVGNDGSSARMENINFPANLDTLLAVGSIEKDSSISRFSCSGRWGDIMASGGKVTSTWTHGKYESLSGTSMATPTVVGVAGLLLQHLRKLKLNDSPQNVKALFIEHAKDIEEKGFDNLSFNGIIQPTAIFRETFREAKTVNAASNEGVEIEELINSFQWWVWLVFAGIFVLGIIVYKNYKA